MFVPHNARLNAPIVDHKCAFGEMHVDFFYLVVPSFVKQIPFENQMQKRLLNRNFFASVLNKMTFNVLIQSLCLHELGKWKQNTNKQSNKHTNK